MFKNMLVFPFFNSFVTIFLYCLALNKDFFYDKPYIVKRVLKNVFDDQCIQQFMLHLIGSRHIKNSYSLRDTNVSRL